MVLAWDSVHWSQWIIYIPTIAVGLPLNLAALWMLFFRTRRYTVSTVFLTNLVISDVLLIFSLPFKIYAYNRKWDLGSGFCSFLESLVYANMYGSILFTVCISVDRYLGLRFPFERNRFHTPRKAIVMCLLIWVLIFGANPTVYTLHDHEDWCFQNFSNATWNKVGLVVAMETIFSISTIVMILCSINVMLILKGLRKTNPQDEKLRNNQSVKIVFSSLIIFLVCFIPYHIAVFIYFWAKNSVVSQNQITPLRQFVHISTCVSSANCLFDGICYYFILKENWLTAKHERKQLSIRHTTQDSIRDKDRGKKQEGKAVV